MPSNQPPRPLTRAHYKTKSGGQPFLVSASPYVLRANRFLTLFSGIFIAITFLFTLRTADEIESYARGGKDRIEKYAESHWPISNSARCSPFKFPGWVETGSTSFPVWRTFAKDCPGTNALPLLATRSAVSAAGVLPSLTHLQNQTVLIINDLQPTQQRVSDLCELIPDARRGTVGVNHPWGSILQQQKDVDSLGHGLGSYCYVPSVDLLIHHFPQGSLLNVSGTPSEDRLKQLLPALFKSWSTTEFDSPTLPRPRQRVIPSLTIWGSAYASDFQSWQHNHLTGLPLINEGTLNKWRARNLEVLHVLDEILTSTPKPHAKQSSLQLLQHTTPTVYWQSPGYGDVSLQSKETSHQLTSAMYSAVLSLFNQRIHAKVVSDPFFENQKLKSQPQTLPKSVKGEFEWRRISTEVYDEKVAVPIWAELLFAALKEI
ncbi:unnamed protein product [Sympodiomycopsis kandeliae]